MKLENWPAIPSASESLLRAASATYPTFQTAESIVSRGSPVRGVPRSSIAGPDCPTRVLPRDSGRSSLPRILGADSNLNPTRATPTRKKELDTGIRVAY